jgi:small-conductance mechanosensitive channel
MMPATVTLFLYAFIQEMGVMEMPRRRLEHSVGLPAHRQETPLAGAAIIVALWLLRVVTLAVVRKRTTGIRMRYQRRNGPAYIAAGISMALIGRICFEGVHSLATFPGLVVTGLVIALKDVVGNPAGGVFPLWRRPFEAGDRIQIGPHAGDVIDIRIIQFTLKQAAAWVDADQSTGRIVHIPDGLVFATPQVNYTRGFDYI